ncbi:putative WD repeat-containing protein C18H10.05 [Silene latifolia]|uniref:putative WD repeat-containing protein C18H10.05 n=1 Tax=Silene latifolia TaxID=37657 RepID=UPI003D77A9FC
MHHSTSSRRPSISSIIVTCVQFNPVDDHYFISSSIDEKVRIWGVSMNGGSLTGLISKMSSQGFVVAPLMSICQFYEAKGRICELFGNW